LSLRAVLGVDAAWTSHGSSGIALAAGTVTGTWKAVAVHSSYKDFIASAGVPEPDDFRAMPQAMVEAARILAPAATLAAIVVDMPLSKLPITGRRNADNLVSKKFGAAGCGTHTPSDVRPGPIAAIMRDGFGEAGFPLATDRILLPGLYETYPHPALLHLMNVARRFPYKVAKASKLWPGVPAEDRWRESVGQLQAIAARLGDSIGGIEFNWPSSQVSLSYLKGLEDQVDALVCAWVGTLIVEEAAIPYGDPNAAVWLPALSVSAHGRLIE
jgi:predicted RNase H-like nuclease